MNKNLRNYAFWLLCMALCLGVFLGSSLEHSYTFLVGFLVSIILSATFFSKSNEVLFISITCISFICLGALRYQIETPYYEENHIANHVLSKKENKVIFTVVEKFKSSKKYLNYKIQIQQVGNSALTGNVLLSIKKETTKELEVSGNYVGLLQLKKIKPTGNPYVFEYSDYLKNNHITHQSWTTLTNVFKTSNSTNYFKKNRFKIQKHLQNQLEKSNLNKDVKHFTAALVLGQKSDLPTDLKNTFIDAGVIHILAISGLHIGILFLLLNSLFKFLFPKQKNNIPNAVFIISILWLYVWFVGSSPSAIRATTMFSCFQISKIIKREQHPINTLFLSIFILILYDPFILFSVGFQLSVAAVAAIILGTPVFLHFWYPKNWILNKIWSISAVSICAQLGVLPFSIFYFHQFSGVFLIANIPIMLVIPIVLITALGIVFCSSIPYTLPFIFKIYNECILYIFSYIKWVSAFEKFIFKSMYINTYTLCCLYLLLIFGIYFLYHPKKISKLFWAPVTLLFLCYFGEKYISITKNELWILNTYNNLIFAELSSNTFNIYSNKELKPSEITYLITPTQGQLHYKEVNYNSLESSYHYKTKDIFILTKKSDLKYIPKNSILILDNSPKINLERLIQNKAPYKIIASNYNYTSFVKKWKSTCKKLQVDFYNIKEQGAYPLSNNYFENVP